MSKHNRKASVLSANNVPATPVDMVEIIEPTTLPVSVTPESIPPDAAPGADYSTHHNATIHAIVGMIRDKYADESTRSFSIGKRVIEHARWQKGNLPGGNYENGDFTNLCNRIRDDVRPYVSIKPESIRVAVWAQAYLLREAIRELTSAFPDRADSFSLYELAAIQGKAFTFSPRDVAGELRPGWADTLRSIMDDRASGKPVTSEGFRERIEACVDAIAAGRVAALTPEQRTAKDIRDNAKARVAAIAKATTNVTQSVVDALKDDALDTTRILGIVETVARAHGATLPGSFGFNPSDCTVADCLILAESMHRAGKHAEMIALRNRLDSLLTQHEASKMEISRAATGQTRLAASPNGV